MKSIFEFIDYRKFLAAYYKEQKEKNRFFSFRYFAQKTGINSPSFLKYVIEGKRNLTSPVIDKFTAVMKLTPKEGTYFRHLVLFNQAKSSAEKQEHYAVLRSMAGSVRESVLNADQFDYFANWYIPVIRELVTLHNFGEDYKLLASMVKPPILPSEAKSAVKLLLRLNFLKKKPDGIYEQKDRAITADSSVVSLALKSYAQSMIEHSKNALETINADQRHVSGMTMGISPVTYAILEAEINAFKDRVKTIVSRDEESTVVYHMNLSLFPLSADVACLKDEKGTA